MTKTDRVLSALMNGEEFTANQIASRFSAVGSLLSLVHDIRIISYIDIFI